jgi:hypothetical protein
MVSCVRGWLVTLSTTLEVDTAWASRENLNK